MPSYHYWLHRGAELHRHDLEGWLAPFLPIRDGIAIMLRLLRESGKVSSQTAVQGVYQQMMAGRVAQMLRLRLSRDYQCVPEISANRLMVSIRLMRPDAEGKLKIASDTDASFELTLCA